MTTPANTPTPRTDALAKRAGFGVGVEGYIDAVYADFARTLERENQQLQQELEIAMGGWKSTTDNLTHFKQLAEERWKMCEELENALRCAINSFGGRPYGQAVIHKALSHFHSLQQQKKDESCSTEEKSNS